MNPFNNLSHLGPNCDLLQKFSLEIIENLLQIPFVKDLIEQSSNIKFTDIDGRRYIKQGTQVKLFEMNVLQDTSCIILPAYYLYSLYYDLPYASVYFKEEDFTKNPLLYYFNVDRAEVVALWRFFIQQNAPIPRDMDVSEYTIKIINSRGGRLVSKLFLKRLSAHNTIWHPESTLVFKSSTERVVIGRLQNNKIIQFDDKAEKLCDQWKFQPVEITSNRRIDEVKYLDLDVIKCLDLGEITTLKNQLSQSYDQIEMLKTQLKSMKLELGRSKLLNHKLLG